MTYDMEAHAKPAGQNLYRPLMAVLSAVVFAGVVSTTSKVYANGAAHAAGSASDVCRDAGRWFDPATRQTLEPDAVLSKAADASVVLLGETHTSKEHHLWQTHTLAGLFANQPQLIVGFEAFPRQVQPVLDAWSRGELSEEEFLDAVRWDEVWGYDANLYMPLFDFARQNRLPMKALNVDRQLVSKVGRMGWANVPQDARDGLTDPTPAAEAYRAYLAEIYLSTPAHGKSGSAEPDGSSAATVKEVEEILDDADFGRFVEAQLTWDRAMAEALAEASNAYPNALVVGILGRGHVDNGYGVPHQLANLGIDDVTSLVPLETGEACLTHEAEIADAVFLVDERGENSTAGDKPRLGVFIEPAADGGILLSRIVEGSIAEAASLTAGDVVVNAAGAPLNTPSDLVAIIERQAPGTWLPLNIRRNGEDLTIVAKFPVDADAVR